MDKLYGNADSLTNLYSENYLRNEYLNFLNNNENCKLIMVDFKKFKYINDTYGHSMGDKYLIIFARLLENVFNDSIPVRLHGDEFCVVTKYGIDNIIKRLELMNYKIELLASSGSIPEAFSYNAGIVDCSTNLDESMNKADYMMYYAKNNNIIYQVYKDDIWNVKIEEEKFLNNIDIDIQNDSFSYYTRNIYDIEDLEKPVMNEFSTRDSRGNSIFSDKYYDLIRDNHQLRKIDLYNLEFLLSRIVKISNNKLLINLDYETLINKIDLSDYLKMMIDLNNISPKNIVLSINLNNIEMKEYKNLIDVINKISDIGVYFCIDKYSSMISDNILENTSIDFLKFDMNYWKDIIYVPKKKIILENKLNILNSTNGTIPIFPGIINEEEMVKIKELELKNSYVSGDYIKQEKKIRLK